MNGAGGAAAPVTPDPSLVSRSGRRPALSVEDIACSAGYRLLFEAITFELGTGQWIQLTGPNGSGKTTLLRAIAGLVRPTRGSVRWNGVPRIAGSPEWHASMLYQGHGAGWKDALPTITQLLK